MSLESRVDHYKELQAEDFDLVENAIEHADRLGLGLYDLRLDKDGRVAETRFLAYLAEGWDGKDKEDIPQDNSVALQGVAASAS